MTKTRPSLTVLKQNLCDDIYVKLLEVKNISRSYKDSTQMVFVRKVEQIQELAARRESLQLQVLDSLSGMVWQIEQDLAKEQSG